MEGGGVWYSMALELDGIREGNGTNSLAKILPKINRGVFLAEFYRPVL